MNNNRKALIIQTKPDSDLGDILQIARSEGHRLFRNPCKITVLEVLHSKYGEIAVVQNSEGCIRDEKTMIEPSSTK